VGECFFLVPAYPGSPGQRAIKRLCVCYKIRSSAILLTTATAVTGNVSSNTSSHQVSGIQTKMIQNEKK